MQPKHGQINLQFWKDFNKLFFSDYLEARRSGLRTDVNEQEIARSGKFKKPN